MQINKTIKLVDQFQTVEVASHGILGVAYEGTGEGGPLVVGTQRLSLAPLNPHIGSTKENQLALAYTEKVFPFGPLVLSGDEPVLRATVDAGDAALLLQRCSYIAWPVVDRGALHLRQSKYYELTWTKHDGRKLEMLWSFDAESNANSLIRVEISDASR